MSSDWWANQIGIASSATTPTGTIPSYGLATDLGTAPWPTAAAFNTATEDFVARERAADIAAAQAKADEADQSYFNQAMGFFGDAIKASVGTSAYGLYRGLTGEYDEGDDVTDIGGDILSDAAETPGISHALWAVDKASNVLETPLIVDRNTGMTRDFGLWFDRSAWGAAWREAEERSLGQAFVDAVISDEDTTKQDLDRMRRTNSLYGLTAFGAELFVGFKADPTVLLAKSAGEARAISKGLLPRGQTSSSARAEAQRVVEGETPYAGFNPARVYGAARGKAIVNRFEDLRTAARELDTVDFIDLPMFRGKAVNGPQAAYAFRLAADNDELWDLTRRAVMGQPDAWAEINRLKDSVPEELAEYGPNARTYLSAIEATKTKMSRLEDEIADLEKVVQTRGEIGPQPLRKGGKVNEGFFKYHTWELDRDLEGKMLDLENIQRQLNQHQTYATWLTKMDENGGPNLEQVSTKSSKARALRQHTYHESPYDKAHTVMGITRAGYVREANPIDLHRVDSGVQSIRRQFEQYLHLFNYAAPREQLNDIMERFVAAPDEQSRRLIAQEVELGHGLQALSKANPGLSPETIDQFLRGSRLRVDDMYNRLLAGDDSIYTTVPKQDGTVDVNIMDGDRKMTVNLPVDATQLPNYYTPMDIRRVHLSIKRNADLFAEIDSARKNFGRATSGMAMNAVDEWGSAFNKIWKPLQLFRLAWPQRVLMDESFRAMAQLGATAWAKEFFPAALTATGNAVKRGVVAPSAFLKRNKVKIGPGPLADEALGKVYNVDHELEVQDAPFVPAYMAPQRNEKRTLQLEELVGTAAAAKRIRDQRAAFLREPNAQTSLPANSPTRWIEAPDDWVNIREALGTEVDEVLDGEDFTVADLINADTDWSDADLMRQLSGMDSDGDVATIASLLAQHPSTIRRILNATHVEGRVPVKAADGKRPAPNDFNTFERGLVSVFGKDGVSRQALRDLAHKGKRDFEATVAKRKSGAGRKPTFSGVFSRIDEYAFKELLLARALGAEWAPVTAGGRGHTGAISIKDILPRELPHGKLVDSWFQKRKDFYTQEDYRFTADPVTGKEIKTGYSVPVVTQKLDVRAPVRDRLFPTGLNIDPAEVDSINHFLAQNQELLGSAGYRVLFHRTPDDGVSLSVARNFRSNELTKAADFAARVNADEFYDIGAGHKRYIRSWDAETPTERLERRFVYTRGEPEFTPGESPADGVPPVFHGTQGDALPDDLRPREEVPVALGNMLGPGFYTTDDVDIARRYAHEDPTKVYTVRNSKTGKKYQVKNMHDAITPEEREAALADYDAWAAEIDPGHGYSDSLRDIPVVREMVGQESSWFDLYLRISDSLLSPNFVVRSARADAWLTRFLEKQFNAGALTHKGGIVLGGKSHNVYVWLHPEDLKVRPLYAKSDKFYQLEEWFSDPDNPSNIVPESRIHRTGSKPRTLAREKQEQDAALSAEFRQTERRELEDAFDDIEFNSSIDSEHDGFIRRLLKRKQFGAGYASFKDHDGNAVHAQQMFEGAGENYVPLISAAPAFSRLTDTYHRTLSQYRKKAVGHKRFLPPDTSPQVMATPAGRKAAREYYTNWADLLNNQVRNSPIWFRMLDGQTDDEIIDWLDGTHEGTLLKQKLPHKGHDPEKWVEEHRQALDFYLPDDSLQTLLRQERVRPSQLRRVDSSQLPEVFGPDLEMIDGGSGFGRVIGNLSEKIYHALGTVPTDLLVRQPFANGMYKLKMNNLIAAADPDKLTNELLRRYEKQSREFAIRQVRRTLFDLSDESNFSQAIRFLAPFWGAQEEALRKWLGIAVERPETVARFYVGVDALYNNFTLIDEDGHRVTEPGNQLGYNANHRVVMQIPKQLKKMPFFKDVLKYQDSVDFALGSANTALQGDQPLLPSMGPMVVFPADKLLRMREDNGVSEDDSAWYRWLFPVGRPEGGFKGFMEQMFPGWARRGLQMSDGERDRTYANTWFSTYREMELDHKKRGLPAPSPKEVTAAVDSLYRLRMVASFALPVPLNPRTNNQFFLDEYHKMQQTYGPGDAFEKFVEKYGVDMARFTASSSESTVGIPPTAAGMKNWMENDDLFRQFGEDWGSAMMSPDAWADDFSSDAYAAQFELSVGDGSSKTLREMRDPEDRLADVDTRTGWLEYRQFMSAIDAELYGRGLTSLEQTGAEDLALMKKNFTNELEARNTAWSRDYRTFEDTIYIKVNELRQWSFDQRFDNRPDIQGVRQYLAIRDQAAQSLDMYAASTGGSRSLQANENTNLRNWFYEQVGSLVQANPAFGEFYSRYLDSDRLVRGSGP